MRLIFIFYISLLLSFLNCGTDTISDGGGLETETISNISGTIVNTDGDSVENAIVVATKTDTSNSIISSDTVLTDEKGFYNFTTLDTGLFTFKATKEINNLDYTAFIGEYYNDSTDIYLGIDTLKATGFVGGNVITDKLATHFMGIEIYIPGTSFSAHSDSIGNYLISSVPVGKHLVAFDEPGFSVYTCSTSVDYPGDTAWIDSVILISETEDYFTLTGILVNQDGTVLSNIEIILNKLDNNDSIVSVSKDTTDNNGTYLFDSLTTGSFIITASIELKDSTYKLEIEETFTEIKDVNIGLDTIVIPDTSDTSNNDTLTEDTTLIKMIDITGGTFTDAPGKQAGVSDFSISETEITLGQFKKFNPTWINLSGTNRDNEPVAGVSLSDCFRFCNWLSKEEGLDTCFVAGSTKKANRVYGDSTYWTLDTAANGYRIPSGDEWEYAAEGGKEYDYATSDGTIKQGNSPATSNAWIPFVADDEIQQVKYFEPNPYGLYDMTGNVWEYTWEADYLSKPNGRSNYFDDSETMNDEFIKVRGESAIYPISSPGLSWAEMEVDMCHTANSKTQHFFSDKARGFRIVRK